VIGAGHGGCAAAGDLGLRAVDVALCRRPTRRRSSTSSVRCSPSLVPAGSVLETSLSNVNAIMHPGAMILNEEGLNAERLGIAGMDSASWPTTR
jgi:hypothetical protein